MALIASEEKPKRINWHRVGFWGALGVAGVFVFSASFHKDRRILTIFESEGRWEMNKFVRFNFPQTAEWLGLNHNATNTVRPIASSR